MVPTPYGRHTPVYPSTRCSLSFRFARKWKIYISELRQSLVVEGGRSLATSHRNDKALERDDDGLQNLIHGFADQRWDEENLER